MVGPRPRRSCRYRIVGPQLINGMNVWTVHEVLPSRTLGPGIGPPCFSYDEAFTRAKELLSNRKVIWFGNTRLVRRPTQELPRSDREEVDD